MEQIFYAALYRHLVDFSGNIILELDLLLLQLMTRALTEPTNY